MGDIDRLVGAAFKIGAHIREDDAGKRVAAAGQKTVDVVLDEPLLHVVDLLFERFGLGQAGKRTLFKDLHRNVETPEHCSTHFAKLRQSFLRQRDLGILEARGKLNDVFGMVADALIVRGHADQPGEQEHVALGKLQAAERLQIRF